MASLLEAQIAKLVASGFKGRLLVGTLRRVLVSGLNEYGDPQTSPAPVVETYTFEGIVDSFNAVFAAQAGIEITDVRVLIIAGSISTVPVKDDQVKVRNEWFQLRELVERDPANATYVFAGFKIVDPT